MEPKKQDKTIQEVSKEIKMAILHSAVMLPGGVTESTLSQQKTTGIVMRWIPGEGLFIQFRSKEALIPEANVKIIHYK